MVNKAKITIDYGSWFGDQGKGYIRINIACSRRILEEGLNRIREAIDE